MVETKKNTSDFEKSRRQFITKILPASALCFGCSSFISTAFAEGETSTRSAKHKFLGNSGMSFNEVFDFAFKEAYIPHMKGLQNQIGKDKFTEMLKTCSSESGKQFGQHVAKSIGKNDMLSLASWFIETEFNKNVCTWKVVEKTSKTFEINYTECLWFKAFQEADAQDIGYAGMCYGEYAFTRAYNPAMKLIMKKTLMQGDDCCNFRFIMEA